MNTAKASVILERAMLRLANATNQQKTANTKLTGRAIALNMCENLLDLRWHPAEKLVEVTTKKYEKYIH